MKELSVAVLGDVGLDVWIQGEITRIAQSAPVPIFHELSFTPTLGLAANVAMHCAELGANVTLYGIVGNDRESNILAGLCEDYSIERVLIPDSTVPTIIKTRFMINERMYWRYDKEGISTDKMHPMFASIIAEGDHDCLIISDYNKGCIQPVALKRILQLNIPVFVDPKSAFPGEQKDHFWEYKNVEIFKPNYDEAMVAVSPFRPKIPETLCRYVANKLQPKHMVMTCAEHGVYWSGESSNRHGDFFAYFPPTTEKLPTKVAFPGDAFMAALVLNYISSSDEHPSGDRIDCAIEAASEYAAGVLGILPEVEQK